MKRILSTALVAAFLCLKISAQTIVAPQINLTGNIGCQGFPCLNSGTLNLTADANANMTPLQTSALGGVKITSTVSLTATRTLIVPAGNFSFVSIENATMGSQSMSICSASGGSCVTIPNGQTIAGIWFDGTNFVAPSSSGGGGTITGVTAGTGLAGGGTSGNVPVSLVTPVAIANGGTGTASPSLVAGSNVTISGTWPNQTVNSTASGTGTLTNFMAPPGSWPSWLVPSVTNSTTTPSLAVAASAIPNAALANPGATINGVTFALGGSINTPQTCGGSAYPCYLQQMNPQAGPAATTLTAAITTSTMAFPIAACAGFTFAPTAIEAIEYNSQTEYVVASGCSGTTLTVTARGFWNAGSATNGSVPASAWPSGANIVQVTSATSASATVAPDSFRLANGGQGFINVGNISPGTVNYGGQANFFAGLQANGVVSLAGGSATTPYTAQAQTYNPYQPGSCGTSGMLHSMPSGNYPWWTGATNQYCTVGTNLVPANAYAFVPGGTASNPTTGSTPAGWITQGGVMNAATGYQIGGAAAATTVNGTSCTLGGSCTVSSGTDTRPTIIQTTGKTGTLAAGGSTTVFSIASGNAGTITFLHFTIGTTGADSPNLLQNSTLNIACDGGSVIVPLGLFFLTQDAPVAFNTDQIAVTLAASTLNGYNSYNRKAYINFTNGCTITLINASSSATAYVFFDTTYKSGTPVGPASQAHWNAYPTSFPTLAANTGAWNYPQAAILPSTTFSGGGQLESVSEFMSNGTNYGTLEATPTATTDGTQTVTANGGEDFFGCGYYCGNGSNSPHTSKWGFMIGSSGLQDKAATYDFLGYRFFTATGDSVFFNSSLSLASGNGDSASTQGVSLLDSLVTYWTANPTVSLPTFSNSGTAVSLADANGGAVICYSTTGTPAGSAGSCTSGTTYSSPITLTTTPVTINAIATLASYNTSPVISGGPYVLATTYVNTTFNEATSGNLGGSTPATCTNGCTGTWVATGPGSDFTYQAGGGVSVTSTSGTGAFDVINTGQTNETIRINMTTCTVTSTNECQIELRYTNSSNFTAINIQPSSGTFLIFDVVAGAATLKATSPSGTVTGLYTITLNGTSISMTGPMSTTPTTATIANTGTSAGFSNPTATVMKAASFSAKSF